MINIDDTAYLIELTRGDSAVISFSATYEDGDVYLPIEGDRLVFGVADRLNDPPRFQIENRFGSFSAVSPTQEEFEADPTKYFTYSGGTYTRCTESDTYDSSEQYYESEFWDIEILPRHTSGMRSGLYAWDVQLVSADGKIETIIGKTDEISPKFKLWGEVAR